MKSKRRKSEEKRLRGGTPGIEVSLSLESSLDSLFGRIENIGTTYGTAGRGRYDLSAQVLETIARLSSLALQKKNRVAARWAVQMLATLSPQCINPLLDISLIGQDKLAKQWAGISLARIYTAIEKRNKKLSGENSAYRKTRAKIGKLRRDIVAPGPIGKIVQEELATGERYRDELLFYRRLFGRNWKLLIRNQSVIRTPIPREYWLTLKLEDFSVRSERDWFEKLIWPRIKKRKAELLPKWQQGAEGRHEAKTGSLYLKAFRSQCRNHLKAVAKLRRVR